MNRLQASFLGALLALVANMFRDSTAQPEPFVATDWFPRLTASTDERDDGLADRAAAKAQALTLMAAAAGLSSGDLSRIPDEFLTPEDLAKKHQAAEAQPS